MNFRIFFKQILLFFALIAALGAANFAIAASDILPSEVNEKGKQYAELVPGNNEQFSNPMNKAIYGGAEVAAIKSWGLNSGENLGLGELWTILQGEWFSLIFGAIIVIVVAAFAAHYKAIGARHYDHSKLVRVFSSYNIFVHWATAIPCVLICISGLIMVFGDVFGGGAFVRFARNIHQIMTPIFAVFGILMLLMWLKTALFSFYDIAWMKMLGGYLDKQNKEIPAGKFNAGQKMWYWLIMLGGIVMVISGAIMFFQAGDIQILRASALIHNVLGIAIIAMLLVHIYMSVFAISGALESMINGHIGEEELALLHSYYYKELKESGKLISVPNPH